MGASGMGDDGDWSLPQPGLFEPKSDSSAALQDGMRDYYLSLAAQADLNVDLSPPNITKK